MGHTRRVNGDEAQYTMVLTAPKTHSDLDTRASSWVTPARCVRPPLVPTPQGRLGGLEKMSFGGHFA